MNVQKITRKVTGRTQEQYEGQPSCSLIWLCTQATSSQCRWWKMRQIKGYRPKRWPFQLRYLGFEVSLPGGSYEVTHLLWSCCPQTDCFPLCRTAFTVNQLTSAASISVNLKENYPASHTFCLAQNLSHTVIIRMSIYFIFRLWC